MIQPADIVEAPLRGELPREFAERMSLEKARATRDMGSDGLILAADTVVAVEGEILGKPANPNHARRMLRLLRDRTHEVITAVCLLDGALADVRSERTRVHFNAMSEEEIAAYIASGEPMDKAGAYAIQGRAARWISKIEGDYHNVVGLPVDLVWRMLQEHGVA